MRVEDGPGAGGRSHRGQASAPEEERPGAGGLSQHGEASSTTRRTVKNLIVWTKAMSLARSVYLVVRSFPSSEKYGLSSQLMRASVSVAANLAEGRGRFSRREFAHFVAIARGSLAECETLVLLARDVGYLSTEQSSDIENECELLYRQLTALHRKLAPATGPMRDPTEA